MSYANKYRFLIPAALLLIIGLLSSCLKEDFSECPHPFRLFIKVLDAGGKDITESGDVKQVLLFVFNEKQEIVEVITVPADKIKNRQSVDIHLTFPGHQSLTFVAWGNTDDKVELPPAASVKQWQDLYVKLKEKNGSAQSPGDLFYGNLNVPIEFGGIEPTGDQTVVISRKTASVVITAIEVKQFNQMKEGNYAFRLKESLNTYDKDGKLTGTAVTYIPAAAMNNGTLAAPLFNTFPTEAGKSYTLEILFNGEVIFTADKGTDGKPFVPEAGRTLNIIIDFRAGLSVMAVITPWGVVHQYVVIN